jgi:hypothetical protein
MDDKTGVDKTGLAGGFNGVVSARVIAGSRI